MAEETREEQLNAAIVAGVTEGIKSRFGGHYGPTSKLLDEIIAERSSSLKDLLRESIQSVIDDPEFRQEIQAAVRANMAKSLVRSFGGEVEKAVNALKSNPETRVRITEAVQQIAAAASA